MASIYLRLKIALMKSAVDRTKYLVDHHIFAHVGKNFYFQPRIIPINAEYIKFHDNVAVATNVTFCNHDILFKVYNGMNPERKCRKYYGCIEVMDNVFIGANSTIMYNVRIGPNAVVAAGSVVTKDVPEGKIVGGVPARVIGDFNDLYERRLSESENSDINYQSAESCWEHFYKARDTRTNGQ